jgi:5'-deoxynucleotidase
MTIAKIYAAGKVRRWHANPALADTAQTNADHQGACVRLLLMLHPAPTVALIRAVAHHDDGERWVGDVPYPFKRAYQIAALHHATAEAIARQQAHDRDPVGEIAGNDLAWLHLVDRLEAFCHVALTRPHELRHDGWGPASEAVLQAAIDLGVGDRVAQLLNDMRARDW